MSQYIGFSHGILSPNYEKQANEQGFTFGDKAEFVDKVGFGLVQAHAHGCITDEEYDRILYRFQNRILINKEFLKRLAVSEDDGDIG